MRDGEACDMERTEDAYGRYGFPLIGIGILDGRGGTCDASVVHQNIEPAQHLDRTGDHASMSCRFDTSQTMVFKPGISFAAASSAFASMSQTQTVAPFLANALATSFPMPAAPGSDQNALRHNRLLSHESPLSRLLPFNRPTRLH